jgi:hypothetical protein
VPSTSRLDVAAALQPDTLYEFQPIGYDAANHPIAFGSVTDATTAAAGQNFALSYQAWRSTHPGTGAPDEDNDGDLIPNLLEYAYDSDPLGPSAPVESIQSVNGAVEYRYNRRTGRFVLWRCEGSTDLQTWTPMVPLTDCQEAVLSSQDGNQVVRVTARPPAGAAQWFLRLTASPVP